MASLIVAGLVTGVEAGAAHAAATGTVSTGSSTVPLNVRSQPNTSSSVIKTIPNGTRITLECWVTGQTVQGRWGPTNLWHRSNGGYVSDGFVYTGTNGPAPGEPKCPSSPPPSSTLSSKVDAFVKKWNGKYADFDGYYGAQCVDLFNFYNRDVVGARRYPVPSAYQLYDKYDTGRYTRLAASATPRKGDVAVWSANYPGSGGHGHVAIVLSDAGRSINTFSQRPGPAQKVTLTKSHLRGYLRPKS